MSRLLRKRLLDPFWDHNPITVQVLGICSALAVTLNVQSALVMAATLTVVLVCSNGLLSCLRAYIPTTIRMIVEMVIISTLVILADQFLKAFLFEISKQLSIFVGLIITNCIVMGRAESFALHNPPVASMLDGLGNGLGYGAVLLCVASVREILGQGSWFGIPVLPPEVIPNGFVLLAPGAFILLGLLVWAQRALGSGAENE